MPAQDVPSPRILIVAADPGPSLRVALAVHPESESEHAGTPGALLAALVRGDWDLVLVAGDDLDAPVEAVTELVARAAPDVPVRVVDDDARPDPVVLRGEVDAARERRARRAAAADLALRERALDAAGDAIAIGDARRPGVPFVHVNAAFERLTGYPAAEILGRTGHVLRAEGTDPAAVAQLREMARTGVGGRVTLLNRRADGSVFHDEIAVSPVREPDGTLTHWVATMREVAEPGDAVLAELARDERRLREIVENVPAVIYLADWDEHATLRYVSPHIEHLLGHPPDAFLADQGLWYRCIHPDDVEAYRALESECFHRRRPFRATFRVRHARGHERWVSESDALVDPIEGVPRLTQGIVVDVTAQRRAEEAVRAERDRAQRYLDVAGAVMLSLDREGRVELLNPAGHRLLGHPDGSLLGADWFSACLPADLAEPNRELFRSILATTESPLAPELAHREHAVQRADGTQRVVAWHNQVLRDPDGTATGVFASGVDITDRREAEAQIAYLAYHDSLTGLPNRAMLEEHLELALARARRGGRCVALLYLDLDDFKLVNDSLGHGAGDELLCHVAMRLRDRLRASDLVARQGGDEFLVLLADLDGDAAAAALEAGRQVVDALAQPLVIDEQELIVQASVGVSLFPRDAATADALLDHADAAMYDAKARGRGEVAVFDPAGPARRGPERLELTTRLRRALARDELVLHWQPIVDIQADDVVGAEALVRWQDPARGLVLPGEFIGVAEDHGLIDALGERVVELFVEQRHAWMEQGLWPRLGFNVSPRELREPEAVRRLHRQLTRRGADLRGVTVEITESAAVRFDPPVERAMREMAEAGLVVCLDDFGVAYSSLGRLRDLPARFIKIDRSFLVGVPEQPQATTIFRAVLTMLETLDVGFVVEGLERLEQRDFLSGAGVALAQGFLLGRPVPAQELESRLRDSATCSTPPTSPGTNGGWSPVSSRTPGPRRS